MPGAIVLSLGASESHSAASGAPQGDSNVNFLLEALRETREVVAAAAGVQRARELRLEEAMSMDEAVAYALANIDPKLLSGRSRLSRAAESAG